MKTTSRYYAFISYSHANEAAAKWLHRAIESYRIPSRLARAVEDAGAATPGKSEAPANTLPKRLYPVFRDRDELNAAPELGHEIQRALADARNLIVICSPEAARSAWVNEEVRYFKALGRSDRVFCLIVDGEPGSSDAECFPPAVRCTVDADGRITDTAAEPIAADLRPGKDSKQDARLKIIAGMLGVGFGQLKQRDLAARNRRLRLGMAVAAGVATVTVGLAIFAFQQRDLAELRRHQAESLVTYMISDLSTSLEGVGRLDLLYGISDQVSDYIGSLSEREKTREIRLFTIMNQLLENSRDDVNAEVSDRLAAFDRALTESKALLDERADDAGWASLAQIHAQRALKGMEITDPELVLESAEAGLNALAQLEQPRAHPLTRSKLLYAKASSIRLGAMDAVLDTDAAKMGQIEILLDESASVAQAVIDVNPLNVTALQAKAIAYRTMASARTRFAASDTAAREADTNAAIAAYRAVLDIEPTHASALNDLGYALLIRSSAYASAWQPAPARADADESRRMQDRLYVLEPNNSRYQAYRAYAMTAQAVAAYIDGDLKAAELVATEAAQFLGSLSAADPSHVAIWTEWIAALAFCAEMRLAQSDLAGAARCADEAVASVRSRVNDDTPLSNYGIQKLLWVMALSAEIHRASKTEYGFDTLDEMQVLAARQGRTLDQVAPAESADTATGASPAGPTIDTLRWLLAAGRDAPASTIAGQFWSPGTGRFDRHRIVRSACERGWLNTPALCRDALSYPQASQPGAQS